jgi:hypothetical protein
VYDVCDACGEKIVRDYHRLSPGPPPVWEWLGVCGCPFRMWRWRSLTGHAPWELVPLPSAT